MSLLGKPLSYTSSQSCRRNVKYRRAGAELSVQRAGETPRLGVHLPRVRIGHSVSSINAGLKGTNWRYDSYPQVEQIVVIANPTKPQGFEEEAYGYLLVFMVYSCICIQQPSGKLKGTFLDQTWCTAVDMWIAAEGF
ncbi:hypothetical protein PANDA_004717 [Ailuropoda melanoleuca]|uniref:Uncharacterized protein n=1 Tax=Ailuropoda melanoleuca TaxID=9646 RepID=D2H4J4_AILME|nr:hypothetical protein PANDA_004717 [Ailuropoda melanoleuca]